MSVTRIFKKQLTESGLGGTLSVTDGLSGVGPPPTLTMSHMFAIWMYPGAPLTVASAQNTASEDRFVKSSRSFDVGDGEKIRDGKPVLRRHPIVFLRDLDLGHRRLQFGIHRAVYSSNELPLKAKAHHQGIQHVLLRTSRTRLAISSFFSSRAKWPASSRWISLSGRSRLNASAPGAANDGSFRPHTTKIGGLRSRNHACHRGIGSDVCPIVIQRIGLDLVLAGSRQVRVLVSPGVRVITFWMRGAEGVTLFGRCERHERVEHFRVRFRIGPILFNGGPLGAQAFLVSVGVLDDQRLQPPRMRRDDAKADRTAIVMEVEGVFVDLELFEKIVDCLGQIVECVHIRRWRRGVTVTEPGKSGAIK